jgi:hypothetical protein
MHPAIALSSVLYQSQVVNVLSWYSGYLYDGVTSYDSTEHLGAASMEYASMEYASMHQEFSVSTPSMEYASMHQEFSVSTLLVLTEKP